MALTISITNSPEADAVVDVSSVSLVHASLVFDASYPSGGHPVSASRFNLTRRIYDCVATSLASRRSGNYAVQYDALNSTIRVFSIPVAGLAWTEVTATSSVLAGVAVKVVVIGY